jgi:hypothetical protein
LLLILLVMLGGRRGRMRCRIIVILRLLIDAVNVFGVHQIVEEFLGIADCSVDIHGVLLVGETETVDLKIKED